MKSHKRFDLDLDHLLGRAFEDDLPLEAEDRMKRRLRDFRRMMEEHRKGEEPLQLTLRRRKIALGRIALASASVFSIILGFSLRPSGPAGALAASLSTYHKAVSIVEQIGACQSMECTVHFRKGSEVPRQFLIQWKGPRETRIQVKMPGEEITRIIHLPQVDRSVLELMAKAGHGDKEVRQKLEAEFVPVEGLLSPSDLLRLLDGKWKPEGSLRRDNCNWESFSIKTSEDEPASRVTVDWCTGLPVGLEKTERSGDRLEAEFRWNSPGAPSAAPSSFGYSSGEMRMIPL